MKKKVIVACGGAVATSTIAANKVVELCKKNGIDVEICQVRISEIQSNLPADLIVTTSAFPSKLRAVFLLGSTALEKQLSYCECH